MTKAKPKIPNPETQATMTGSEQRAALIEALHKIDPSWSGKSPKLPKPLDLRKADGTNPVDEILARERESTPREAFMRELALAAFASQTPKGPQQPLGFQVLVVDLLPAWAFGGGWCDGPFIHHPGARLYLDYLVGGRIYFQGYVRQGILGWFREEQLDKVRRVPDNWDETYARVRAKAIDVLGSEEKADCWLRAPNRALGGRQPLGILDTEEGTQEVLNVLVRIEYGVLE
jgi:hypothetical protein